MGSGAETDFGWSAGSLLGSLFLEPNARNFTHLG